MSVFRFCPSPARGKGGTGMGIRQPRDDQRANTLEVRHGLIIPEAQDLEVFAPQEGTPPYIHDGVLCGPPPTSISSLASRQAKSVMYGPTGHCRRKRKPSIRRRCRMVHSRRSAGVMSLRSSRARLRFCPFRMRTSCARMDWPLAPSQPSPAGGGRGKKPCSSANRQIRTTTPSPSNAPPLPAGEGWGGDTPKPANPPANKKPPEGGFSSIPPTRKRLTSGERQSPHPNRPASGRWSRPRLPSPRTCLPPCPCRRRRWRRHGPCACRPGPRRRR